MADREASSCKTVTLRLVRSTSKDAKNALCECTTEIRDTLSRGRKRPVCGADEGLVNTMKAEVMGVSPLVDR